MSNGSDVGFLVHKTFYFKGRHLCFPGPLANKRYPDMQCNIGVRLKWRALKQHHDHNPNPTSIQLPGYIHTTALPFQHHDQAEIDTVLVGNKYLKAPSPSSSLPVPSRSPTQLQQPLLPSSPPLASYSGSVHTPRSSCKSILVVHSLVAVSGTRATQRHLHRLTVEGKCQPRRTSKSTSVATRPHGA